MSGDLQISIADGVEYQGTSRPYSLVTASWGRHSEIELPLASSDLLDANGCARELVNAGLPSNFSAKEIRDKLLAARSVATRCRKKVAITTGWHDNAFLFNGRIHQPDQNEGVICTPEMEQARFRYPKNPNTDLIDLINQYGPSSYALSLGVMAAFAMPLLGCLAFNERPLIHFFAESKTGKTTLLNVVQALTTASPDEKCRRLNSFSTTFRALEEELSERNDSVLCMDETSATSAGDVAEFLSEFIYTAANGRGRQRSKGSPFANLNWRTMVLFSGEYDLRMLASRQVGTGQDARLLTVQIAPRAEGGIFSGGGFSERKLAKVCAKLSRAASAYDGSDFEGWIARIVNVGRERAGHILQRKVDKYVADMVGDDADSLTRTIASRFAAFAATGDYLIEAKILNWPAGFPFRVANAALQADLRAKRSQHASSNPSLLRHAQAILAKLYVDQEGQAADLTTIVEDSIFVRKEKGIRRLIVRKGALTGWLGIDEQEVYEALTSNPQILYGRAGAIGYAQVMIKAGARILALKIDLEKLAEVAFPRPSGNVPSSSRQTAY